MLFLTIPYATHMFHCGTIVCFERKYMIVCNFELYFIKIRIINVLNIKGVFSLFYCRLEEDRLWLDIRLFDDRPGHALGLRSFQVYMSIVTFQMSEKIEKSLIVQIC